MRPLFAYLNAAVVPTAVYAASEDWGGAGDASPTARSSSGSTAPGASSRPAMAARAPQVRTDPYADPIPFEQLLRGNVPPD